MSTGDLLTGIGVAVFAVIIIVLFSTKLRPYLSRMIRRERKYSESPGAPGYGQPSPRTPSSFRPRGMRWGLILALIIVLAVSSILVSMSVVIVPSGYRGVLLTWGQVTGVLGECLHFKTPMVQSVEMVDITIRKAERAESTGTSDLQEVTTTIAVNYRLNPAYVDEIYRTLRQDYESRVVTPNIAESIKATTASFQAAELITKREQVKTKFLEIMRSRLEPFHMEVLSVSVTDFKFSAQFNAAIEAKVTAEQRALEAKNKLEQIRYEAQQQVIQAQAEANATIARAEAEAQKRIIEATAEAEAIRLINAQLTPLYLQQKALEQWDGKMPYFFGGDVLPFIQVPTNSTSP